MFSNRFQRLVVISSHAKIRMVERDISEAMLLDVIDSGNTRYAIQGCDPFVGVQGIPGTAR